jgi:hypothetical protein
VSDATSAGPPRQPSSLRETLEPILLVGALSSAVMSVLGLVSTLARLVSVRDGWAALMDFARALPGWALAALNWIGAAFHNVIEAYRDVVYPIVEFLLQYVSIRLVDWQVDLLFIFFFSLLSASKNTFLDKDEEDGEEAERPMSLPRVVLACVNWPINAILGLGIMLGVNVVDRVVSFVTGAKVRPIYDLYMWLRWPFDRLVVYTLCNALVLGIVFAADWTYTAFFQVQA